eukprot:366566-Chlamydomonas_euryale.AAC.16
MPKPESLAEPSPPNPAQVLEPESLADHPSLPWCADAKARVPRGNLPLPPPSHALEPESLADHPSLPWCADAEARVPRRAFPSRPRAVSGRERDNDQHRGRRAVRDCRHAGAYGAAPARAGARAGSARRRRRGGAGVRGAALRDAAVGGDAAGNAASAPAGAGGAQRGRRLWICSVGAHGLEVVIVMVGAWRFCPPAGRIGEHMPPTQIRFKVRAAGS